MARRALPDRELARGGGDAPDLAGDVQVRERRRRRIEVRRHVAVLLGERVRAPGDHAGRAVVVVALERQPLAGLRDRRRVVVLELERLLVRGLVDDLPARLALLPEVDRVALPAAVEV